MDAFLVNSALDGDAVDIDKYLPIKSDEEAMAFCRNDDGILDQRKKALVKRLYGAGDVTSISNFVASVAEVFFDHNYRVSHRWPSKQ